MSKNILVIEVYQRGIGTVTRCKDKKEAVKSANDLLKEYLKYIGYPEGWQDNLQMADELNLNAWCNLNNKLWDAYIVEF